MTVIFDLDYTLLDTHKFKAGLADALGLSINDFNDSYKKYFKDKRIPYNIEQHLMKLASPGVAGTGDGLVGGESKERVEKFLENTDAYLFPEAKPVLKKMKKAGYKLVLFTYGDISWQKYKVGHLRIKNYFDEVIFTDKEKGKSENLKSTIEKQGENIIRHGVIAPVSGNNPHKFYNSLIDKVNNSMAKREKIGILRPPAVRAQNDASLDMRSPKNDILIVNDNAKESLEIKEMLGRGEIFLVKGPYSQNAEHKMKIRELKDLL